MGAQRRIGPAVSEERERAAAGGVLATTALAAAWGSQMLGYGKTWAVDRARLGVATALEGRRLVAEHPEWGRRARIRAYATGSADLRRPMRMVRDVFIGPTRQTVPISGGALRLPGGKVVDDAWGKAFRFSNRLGSSLGAINAVSGTINLASGIQQRGVSGIVETQEGRMGVLQLASVGWGQSFNAAAAAFHRDPGQTPRQAFHGASWLAEPGVRTWKFAGGAVLGITVTANLLGGLDWLDADDGE